MENFKFKKKYGQNFLRDENILKKIVNPLDITSEDLIIEIGPGDGALTKYLVRFGCKVLAFEIDTEVKEKLESLNAPNLEVIYKDFLFVSLKDYHLEKYQNIWIIANIPYYITTPIIEKIIAEKINEKRVILMVQEEVADRFSAKPSSNHYGSVTVYLNYYYEIKKLFRVPRKCFYPIPNVDSAIISLEPHHKYNVDDPDKFFSFIKESFLFKRKNLRNNLKKYDLTKIEEVLKLYNHTLQNRAEDLSLEEFISIYQVL